MRPTKLRLAVIGTLAILLMTFVGTAAAVQSQSTSGPCSPNYAVTEAPVGKIDGASGRVTEHAMRNFLSSVRPCVVVQPNQKLNALEVAQRQLLIAQNPTRLSVREVVLRSKLGESRVALWLNINNESSFEAHGLKVKLSQPEGRPIKAPEQQAFVLPRLPDALVHQKSISLEGKGNVLVLVADSDVLAQVISQSRPGWCLYDVGIRADDADIDGYREAMENNLIERQERSTYDTEPWVSSTLSIPVALTVQYTDLFEITHEFPAVGFLRVAETRSKRVFYPSRRAFGELRCLRI